MLRAKKLWRIIPGRSTTPENSPQEWSIPEPTTDLDRLIERDDIDLYVIAVPNEEHPAGFFGAFPLEEKPGMHETFGP